tara:strand:+ start:321 stop:476 length:156 start_codon:yes stop_codon:yes gene_type:complete
VVVMVVLKHQELEDMDHLALLILDLVEVDADRTFGLELRQTVKVEMVDQVL